MSGFLLNMIHRHQGLVDRVQPRIRSIFEPEPAPAATDNAFANTADATVNMRPDTGFESPSAFTNFKGLEKSSPETAPPEPLPVMFRKSVQTDESDKVSDLNPLAGNRIGLINEQMQSLLARLAGKPETQEKFIDDPHGLQKPASSEATAQAAINIVSIEQGLSSRIEATLGRLTSQASYSRDGQSGFEDHAHLAPAHADKTEADPLARLPRQTGNKAEESGEALHKPTSFPAEPVNAAAISSQAGTLQPPAWLKDLQTSLNARWRETDTHAHADPVINVTIGRIEVRAINTEPVKPSAAQGKPKGVLSLDDYLKQRESKGRT